MPIFQLDDEKLIFPPAEWAEDRYDGLLAVGGDLSVPRLVEAYANGIFPWPCFEDRLDWYSPDPRFVLFPEKMHIPKSLKRVMKKEPFRLTVDQCFPEVIHHCGSIERPGQEGSWITREIEAGYCALHQAGYAHSLEAWDGNRLVGGFYGVSIGRCFCGESMFSLVPDASKVTFATFAPRIFEAGYQMIDCQVYTDHLARFGAEEIPRAEYLLRLRLALKDRKKVGDLWARVLEEDVGWGGGGVG